MDISEKKSMANILFNVLYMIIINAELKFCLILKRNIHTHKIHTSS